MTIKIKIEAAQRLMAAGDPVTNLEQQCSALKFEKKVDHLSGGSLRRYAKIQPDDLDELRTALETTGFKKDDSHGMRYEKYTQKRGKYTVTIQHEAQKRGAIPVTINIL